MKVAPLREALLNYPDVDIRLVHTGQHYDYAMSQALFEDFEMPAPDVYLEVGPADHAVQTARTMERYDEYLSLNPADVVVVVGDVNSTLACSLVAAKRGVAVAHVEAGLRSGDRSMPEEINRILTDQLADYCFTPSQDASENLRRENVEDRRIFLVGNIMIDTLRRFEAKAATSRVLERLGLFSPQLASQPPTGEKDGVQPYGVITLHRPSNVDDPKILRRLLETFYQLSNQLPLIFPVHPRTAKRMGAMGFPRPAPLQSFETQGIRSNGLVFLESLGYLDFSKLLRCAKLVLTDSGGIQEETTFLGVPCLTLRDNTERPITLTEGTNVLVGRDPARILSESLKILKGSSKKGKIPFLWDGQTAKRIARILVPQDQGS
jgi:UDP-N-acetylglucosamine 2-epimerase (non-hydrolysing)